MYSYLQEHRQKRYLPDEKRLPGLKRYHNRAGWDDFYIGRSLIFSHRATLYDAEHFPDKLHSHSFYEMDIYCSGQISYVSDDREIIPQKDNILIFPPGCFHTARLLEASRYERVILYFSPQVFSFLGPDCVPALFEGEVASCHCIRREARGDFFYLLEKLKDVIHSDQHDAGLLAYSYALQLLLLIARCSELNTDSIAAIPQKVLEVKEYVDDNFRSIATISEVASHFFYSREYISRIFKQYYNLNLSEYLSNKKIDCAKGLLGQGQSVGFAFDASGFRSMSSFVNAFKSRTGVTPSEFKRSRGGRG